TPRSAPRRSPRPGAAASPPRDPARPPRGLLDPRAWLRSPARMITAGTALLLAAGTFALTLPFARTGEEPVPFVDALFTAASALCVTGLITVDTATYWSRAGQVVILLLIQIGGLGVMT